MTNINIEIPDQIHKTIKLNAVLQDNTIKEEALSALIMLGFAKNAATKAVDKLLSNNKSLNVEDLIKLALKQL